MNLASRRAAKKLTLLSRRAGSRAIWALLMGSVLATLPGCVANRMFRVDSIDTSPLYSLAFIEFDDQGELWSPAQVSRALDVIQAANIARDGAIVVVFVHGWNHNASLSEETSKHGNVLGFRRMLTASRRWSSIGSC